MKRTNWTKFAQIRVKFVRKLYDLPTNFTEPSMFTYLPSIFVRTKFIRSSYKFCANFLQFGHEASKHPFKHTLQSHGQVIDHAPALEHLAAATLGQC